MGDVLSGIFGGGSRQSQQTSVDRTTGNLNALRATQLQGLFDQTPLWSFASPAASLYTPTEADQSLLQTGMAGFGQAPALSLQDYLGYAPGRDLLEQGTGYAGNLVDSAIANAQQETAGGIAGVDQRTAEALNALGAGVTGATGDIESAYQRAAKLSNERLNTALNLGSNTMQGYLSSVATPQIMQQMALQGLEGGGAVPEAIARAGAEVAMPFLSSTLSQYGQEQYGLSQADIQALQALESLGISTGATLRGQGTQLASGLTGQDISTAASLRNAQLGAGTGLFQSFIPTEASFVQSLPNAAALSTSVPAQAALTRAQGAATLFPMADYPRSLAAEDYTRRQGLATTGLTGIPYTPQTNVQQRTSQQPLFNWFGQG